MPISALDGLSEAHWAEVLAILSDAIEAAGFTPNLVSNADDVGIIQKRIIQNIYDNPIVVCDVSGKNPNVMFELGMRLAFDKPTLIVKDDKTTYSFDTSPIEHIPYPRDLRFAQIADFKLKLIEKIKGTHKAAADPRYTTFLKHFGEFTVAKLEQKEVSGETYLLEEMRALRAEVKQIAIQQRKQVVHPGPAARASTFTFPLTSPATADQQKRILEQVRRLPGVANTDFTDDAILEAAFRSGLSDEQRDLLAHQIGRLVSQVERSSA
ncbi:hypothetical protein [Bradyrhizobium sp. LHD-71]|uniref:hypothetical protein n=1 Tax=Bradyrhizobium sp. LHD-71 TaxID=3072141 RepID=UPI00280CBCC3|nr:hypothetical protein [Bradyrhizobium sp. LHD-71]MDQ8731017.1 hypothetical protein [Bradyrhizobium sp. LHD-71]